MVERYAQLVEPTAVGVCRLTCRLALPESVFLGNHPVDRTVNPWVLHRSLLSDSLELDDEIREAARSLLAETEQWLDAMPVGRRCLITSPYSDIW